MLDKVWVECLMPREYEYLHHGVTQLGTQKQVQVKVIVSNIIASSRASTGVPLVLVKMTRQTNKMNNLHTLFIYYWYSFLLWGASLKVHHSM
jgi:hypothetical protein